LYDARRMQTSTALIILLASAAVTAVAAEPPVPPAGAATPQFSASDQVPESAGFEDAFSLIEVKLGGKPMTDAEQVTRWLDELKAGRARAGSLVGSHLSYLALTPGDCDAARDALTRAEELGHDRAARSLADLASNSSCGDVDYAVVEKWLKKAVMLDYLVGVQRLVALYAPEGRRPDAFQQYVYARVGAGYWESVYPNEPKPTAITGFDAVALQEIEKTLAPADRKRAESEAAKILTAMLKRHERFKPVAPQEFSRGGQAANASRGSGFVAYTSDYRHECAWNLVANCRGAQRLAFVDVSNNENDFMFCKANLNSKDFVSGETHPLTREVLVGPKVTRRLILGDVYQQPDKSAMTVTCKAIAKLAENSAAGKCRARLKGTIDAQQFYPPAAKQQGIEGSAVVRYFIPPGSEEPADAEIAQSSGHEILDAAALDTIRSGKFASDCDYGLSSIRIAFKLQE
jgi:TonB family protein